jgi:3-oxoacyl-[acyl-carrier protein] reductase
MTDLTDRVAIVTGGASGIGAAIARSFDAAGAHVMVVDIAADAARRLAGELQRGTSFTCDVAQPEAVEAIVKEIGEKCGRIDVLVNNAGIAGTVAEVKRRSEQMDRYTTELLENLSPPRSPIEITVNTTTEDWRRIFAIHVDGTFFFTRETLKWMLPAQSGSIVNISSICGLIGCVGTPSYSAAKAAIIGFTRSVAKEVANQGVRVNAVAPGYIDTSLSPVRSTTERALTVASVPLGRLGTPEEIAESVLFLAGDSASYYTGSVLTPNGGAVM